MSVLNTKYRPKSFDEVVGQDSVVSSLKNLIERNSSQAYLLHGPSGVGKTTLARICAEEFGQTEIREYDAASNSGVADMRDIIKMQEYYALNNGARVFIIDECHMLSAKAWDVLLKATEEPPEKNYWFFCTTEYSKVPKTIKTRCSEFKLSPVSPPEIFNHLKIICSKETLSISDDIIKLISESVDGSPRKALSVLDQSVGLDINGVKEILLQEVESKGAYDLAKALMNKYFSLDDVISICKDIKSENPEAIRQTVRSYHTTVLLSNSSNDWSKNILVAFEKPAIVQNKISDIILRIFQLDKWRN